MQVVPARRCLSFISESSHFHATGQNSSHTSQGLLKAYFSHHSFCQPTILYLSPIICDFAVCDFRYLWAIKAQKPRVLLLMEGQRVNSSLGCAPCLRHSPHFTLSRRHFILSLHHRKKDEYGAIRYFERRRPHSHAFSYSTL